MLNIVIIGAGDVGRYIASILSKEEHNITLIDENPHKLIDASNSMDVATREGSGTDWQLLDDLLELSPHLLLALSDKDEINLVACSIAKHLGFPRTVARVGDSKYLNRMRLDFGRIFNVDYFVAPDVLVAHDILKFMSSPGSLHIENFAQGVVQMRTIAIPGKWKHPEMCLKDLELPEGIMVGLIRRGFGVGEGSNPKSHEYKIIFPHGNDCILPGDEVTFIGETEKMMGINQFFGLTQKKLESAVIVGGSRTGIHLAKLLESREIHVQLIDKSYEKCCQLTEILPNCSIIHHDATDLNFLKAEKVGQTDMLVACTKSDEVNIVVGLLGKQVDCRESIVVLTNISFTSLADGIGLAFTSSPRICAANHILSQILAGKVTSLISLYDNQAEIIEVNVSSNSPVVGIPLNQLGPMLPHDFLIAMIQNRGRIMIADGNRIISPGDTVIVITNPKHSQELEKIF